MYTLREAWNPSTTECKSYCKTQKPSEEKALKGMEISSLQVCNRTFWLYSNMIWSKTQDRLLSLLPNSTPLEALGSLMIHTLTKEIYIHPSTQVTVLRRGKQSRGRNPLNLSGNVIWDVLKYAVGLEKGQELDCGTAQVDKVLAVHQLTAQVPHSVWVLLQDEELLLYLGTSNGSHHNVTHLVLKLGGRKNGETDWEEDDICFHSSLLLYAGLVPVPARHRKHAGEISAQTAKTSLCMTFTKLISSLLSDDF